jgi:molybdate transport system ATP-binding protein
MNLRLQDIRLPLSAFALELNLTITSRATALFGASGAGKTSLLDLVAGLRRPERARIEFDGEVFTDTGHGIAVPPHRRRIGYVPQDGALFPHLTVRENLRYGFDLIPPAERRTSLEQVARVLEIAALLDRRMDFLSGGEKQRVACGRALLAQPRLLLLDEPLAGLDSGLKSRFMPYLLRLRDEFDIPMLYVTHEPGELVELCEEVVVIDRGRCVAQGPVNELFAERMERGYELRLAAKPPL